MMTNKNKEFKEDANLEKMLETASMKTKEEEKSDKDHKGSSKKAVLITSGVMLAFGALLAVGALSLRPQEFEDKTKDPTWIAENEEKETAVNENSQWDFEYPVEVPKWSKQPFADGASLNNEETLAEVNKFAEDIQSFQASVSWMPSGVQGTWDGAGTAYTNKIEDKFINDNVINPEYAYALKEDYVEAYSTYVQRLINPTFGEWIFAQKYSPAESVKNKAEYQVLNDMFSDEWWAANVKENEDYSAIPVLADWNGDNFGGLEFAEPVPSRYGTFFGVVNETEENYVTVETLGKDERDSEILKIDTPVKYVAFGVDDELIEKFGTLSMTLASNSEPISPNRVVIVESKLTLN